MLHWCIRHLLNRHSVQVAYPCLLSAVGNKNSVDLPLFCLSLSCTILQTLTRRHYVSLPALLTPNYYYRTTTKTNSVFSANKRVNDSQVRPLAVDASLGGVFSFTTEALLDQAYTIETLRQKSQTLLKKDFNTTADSSKSETSRDELAVDCKLRAKRLRRTFCQGNGSSMPISVFPLYCCWPKILSRRPQTPTKCGKAFFCPATDYCKWHGLLHPIRLQGSAGYWRQDKTDMKMNIVAVWVTVGFAKLVQVYLH